MIFAVDATQLTIAIGGVLGGLSTIYGTYRYARKDHSASSAANAAILLGGWREFADETRKEVERVRVALQQQIADLKAEHTAERAEWARDSEAKQAEIDQLRAQILILWEEKTRRG